MLFAYICSKVFALGISIPVVSSNTDLVPGSDLNLIVADRPMVENADHIMCVLPSIAVKKSVLIRRK